MAQNATLHKSTNVKGTKHQSEVSQEIKRIDELNQSAFTAVNSNIDSARIMVQTALKLSRREHYDIGIRDAFKVMGIIEDMLGNFDKALVNYNLALNYAIKSKDEKSKSAIYNNIGFVLYQTSNYPEALKYHLKSLRIREKRHDLKGMGISYNNLGLVYQYGFLKGKEAKSYYLKSLSICLKIKDSLGLSDCYNNLGTLHIEDENYPIAITFIEKSMKISEALGDKSGKCEALNNLAGIYCLTEDYSKAIKYYNEELKESQETDFIVNQLYAFSGLSCCYIAKKDYKKTMTYLLQALKIAQKIGYPEQKVKIYELLSSAYEKMGQSDKALASFKMYKAISDSINNDDVRQKSVYLKANYEFDKKTDALEIKQLQIRNQFLKKVQKRDRAISLILFLIIVLGMIAFIVHRKNQKFKVINSHLQRVNYSREQRLQQIIENTNEIIYTINPNGHFEYVSPRWSAVLGHEKKLVEGAHFSSFIHPDDVIKFQDFLDFIFENRKPKYNVEYKILHNDGTWRWHISNGSSTTDSEANQPLFIGAAIDVTDSKNIRNEIQLTEEKFRFITDNTASAIGYLEDNVLTYLSKSYEQIFGYSFEEEKQRIDNDIWSLIPYESERKNVSELIMKNIKSRNKVFSYQYRYRHKDGHYIWRQDYVNAFYNESGRAMKCVFLFQDISDKKKLEERLRKNNNQLIKEIAEKEKIEFNFIAFENKQWLSISRSLHDNISQLLFAAKLHLESDVSKSENIRKGSKLIELALSEMKNLVGSTKNLLLNGKNFGESLNDLIENTNGVNNFNISKRFNSKSIEQISLSEQIILFSIIQESIQNAIKHSGGNKIHISSYSKDQNIIVKIADNGKGLSDDQEKGMGILNINHYAKLLDAELEYKNQEGLVVIIKFNARSHGQN